MEERSEFREEEQPEFRANSFLDVNSAIKYKAEERGCGSVTHGGKPHIEVQFSG
ncbi:MAG: hypothetical protein MW690_001120 [Methanophagales archaeon]|nr:hypothetical protein [Methanophagales archaeon]